MTPLVSIIIPCYRQGRYLAASVNAVLAQSYPRIEIVVVNDGSDDNTDEVARGFGSRIVYVAKRNGGHSSARNAGLERATGDYIYFLDADDLIHPESIASLVGAAEAGGGCIAMMGYRTFEREGEWQGGEDAPPVDSLFPWVLVRNYPLHCYLVPRSVALAVKGFDRSMVSHEDHEFWLRIAALKPAMRSVPLRGAYYRQHPGSESKALQRMALGRLELLKRTTEFVATDERIAADHGAEFLRHLYVSRLIFAAQAPEIDRSELDDCIAKLHRAGVRSKIGAIDWCYALIPRPWRSSFDTALLGFLRATGLKTFDPSSLAART